MHLMRSGRCRSYPARTSSDLQVRTGCVGFGLPRPATDWTTSRNLRRKFGNRDSRSLVYPHGTPSRTAQGVREETEMRAYVNEKLLSCRWQTARRICAVCLLPKYASPHMCYHVEFGRSMSKGVKINRGNPKLESVGASPLGWEAWPTPIKHAPPLHVLCCRTWSFCIKGCGNK